jgi:peptidoglycan biosynthesis protein MviN/MurJ (putative lipid II flippase)
MINLFFSFKNFKADNAHQLWIILLLLFGLWFGGLLGALTSTTFFAKGDTKTPTVLTSILFTIYLPIKVFVFKYYGISGLALSISIYMMFSLLFQMYFLRKKSMSRLL